MIASVACEPVTAGLYLSGILLALCAFLGLRTLLETVKPLLRMFKASGGS